jgi:hypothetical protein
MDRSHCDSLILYGSFEPTTALLTTHLPALVQKLTQPVFVGGTVAQTHQNEILQTGAVPLAVDLAAAVIQIEDRLPNEALP